MEKSYWSLDNAGRLTMLTGGTIGFTTVIMLEWDWRWYKYRLGLTRLQISPCGTQDESVQ